MSEFSLKHSRRNLGTLTNVHSRPVRVRIHRDPQAPDGVSDSDILEFRPLHSQTGVIRLTMREIYQLGVQRFSNSPETKNLPY